MSTLYIVIVVGIVLWAAIVFQALMGMRLVKLKGAAHWKVHRLVGLTMIAIGLLHGMAALGLLVFAWF